MANEKNLGPPFNQMPPEKQREIAKKGAAASAKVRRERKKTREILEILMTSKIKDAKLKKRIKDQFDLSDKYTTYDVLIQATAIKQAIKGNITAMTYIRDSVGDGPGEALATNDVAMLLTTFNDNLNDNA
jgi:hypothetical protein